MTPTIVSSPRSIRAWRRAAASSIRNFGMVPQFPDPWQQEIVRISAQRKVGQIGERVAAALGIEFARRGIPADDLRDFDVEQMGRVRCLSSVEQPPFHRCRCRRAEERFEQGRSVDDDHWRSRSARIA